jgi:hypothetical protein
MELFRAVVGVTGEQQEEEEQGETRIGIVAD